MSRCPKCGETASPVGFLLAVYWAWVRYRSGERPMMVAMLLIAALALAAIWFPFWFWSHIFGL